MKYLRVYAYICRHVCVCVCVCVVGMTSHDIQTAAYNM